jgi:hypothetical protein
MGGGGGKEGGSASNVSPVAWDQRVRRLATCSWRLRAPLGRSCRRTNWPEAVIDPFQPGTLAPENVFARSGQRINSSLCGCVDSRAPRSCALQAQDRLVYFLELPNDVTTTPPLVSSPWHDPARALIASHGPLSQGMAASGPLPVRSTARGRMANSNSSAP